MTTPEAIIKGSSRMGTVLGLTTVILGILAMAAPMIAGLTVAVVVAAMLLAAGVAMTAYAFSAGTFWRGLFQFLFGGLTALAGVVLLFRPLLGLASITMVLVVYFMVDGISTRHPRVPDETDQGLGLDGFQRYRGRRVERIDLARMAVLRGVGHRHFGGCAAGDVGVGHDRVGRHR